MLNVLDTIFFGNHVDPDLHNYLYNYYNYHVINVRHDSIIVI